MNTNSKYKNIIFDLGAVLINWNPASILQNMFQNKKNMSLEKWKEVFTSKDWRDCDRGIITEKELIKILSNNYDKDIICYFLQNIDQYLYPLAPGLKIFNHVKSEGYKIYILSNFPQERFERISLTYRFLKGTDGTVISFQTKSQKPEPEIYKILLNKYSLKPEECLFIDDLEENIIGAKAVGIDGVICKNHEYLLGELKRLGVLPQEAKLPEGEVSEAQL